MYNKGKACWLNHLDTAMENYKNHVHGTLKRTPFELVINTKKSILHTIPNNNNKLPKFQVGEFVSVPDKRNLSGKSCTTNWNRELFIIHKINPTNPVTYGSTDENNEQIEGKYYEQEFLEVYSILYLKTKRWTV